MNDGFWLRVAKSPRVGLLPPITAEPVGSSHRSPLRINYGHYDLGERAPLEALCTVEDDVEDIDLRSNALPAKTLRRLLRMVGTMPRLSTLDLSENSAVSALDPSALTAMVEGCRTLAVLRLAKCALKLQQVRELCTTLEKLAGRTPLHTLDLSGNVLGRNATDTSKKASSKWLSVLMSRERGLKHLDLSSNALCGGFANAIAVGLRDSGIETLNLSRNALGTDAAGAAIAHGLGSNDSVVSLDLSSNSLGAEPGLVLANAVWVHPTLRTLIVSRNPMGLVAARALLRAVATKPARDEDGGVCDPTLSDDAERPPPPFILDIRHVELRWPFGIPDVAHTEVWFVDPAHEPAGRYDLALGTPLKWAIAVELVRLKRRFPLCFTWKKNGGCASFKPARGAATVIDDLNTTDPLTGAEAHWLPPTSGRLLTDITFSRLSHSEDESISDSQLDSLLHAVLAVPSASAVQLVEAVMPDLVVRSAQGRRLYKAVAKGNDADARRVVDAIFPHVVDDLPGFLGSAVPMRHLKLMTQTFGQLLTFDHVNPNGRYVVHLTKPGDRTVLRELIAANNKEKRLRAARADTSQRFKSGDNFRNTRYYEKHRTTGVPFVIKGDADHKSAALPRFGMLMFDYVSTLPPPPDATPMHDERLWLEIGLHLNGRGVPYLPVDALDYFAHLGTIHGLPAPLYGGDVFDVTAHRIVQHGDDAPADDEATPKTPRAHALALRPQTVDDDPLLALHKYQNASPSGLHAHSAKAPGPSAIMDVWGNVERGLQALRRTMTQRNIWITAQQAADIARGFPSFGGARLEALAILFGRTCAKERGGFARCALGVLTEVDGFRLASRLGWLNILNPDDVDHSYYLDLSRRDERIVAQHLARLSTEPGENWTREGFCKKRSEAERVRHPWKATAQQLWELQESWVNDNVPTSGYVWLTFASPSKRVRDDKKRWRLERDLLCGGDAHARWEVDIASALSAARGAGAAAAAAVEEMWAIVSRLKSPRSRRKAKRRTTRRPSESPRSSPRASPRSSQASAPSTPRGAPSPLATPSSTPRGAK